jgi:group I intron endonuclease
MINSNETGVYKIINLINNKIYIGSSTNEKGGFKDRINTHIRLLNRNTHPNKHLQSAWNKYGEDNFEFKVIEVVKGKEKIIEREQYYIDSCGVIDNKIGYNKSPIANSQLGFKHSNETKKKMSDSAKIYSNEISKRMKELRTGQTLSETTKKKISEKLTGLKRGDEFKEKMRVIGGNRIVSDETKKKISDNKKGYISEKRKSVYQLDLDGNIIKLWLFSGEAEAELKITKGKISEVCLGKRKTTGGFKWVYKDEMDKT